MTIKVLFLQEMSEELQTYFEQQLKDDPIELIFPDQTNEEHLLTLAPLADVLIGWRPSYELLESATKAKALINPGVGVKRHIEPFKKLNEHRDNPLLLINGHGNAYFTAEHAVALLLALYNKIVQYHNSMIFGNWRKLNLGSSNTLRNKTVGLLGFGAINQHVHQFLSGFHPKFIALKRSWQDKPEGISRTYVPDQLDEFLTETDILMMALPRTSQTEGMIGKHELELLGKDAVIINVARGIIIEEEAFYAALKNGIIAGAGIDVWYNYDPDADENGNKYPTDYQFHDLDNVVLSPHRAASPFENLERWDEQLDNLRRIAAGRNDLRNIVDLEREY